MTDPRKIGRRNKQRGYEGEAEVRNKLTAAGIDCYRTAPPGEDLRVNGQRVEVKRRKDGFREIYGWLEKDAATYLFMRADRRKWLVVMDLQTFLEKGVEE